MCDLAVSACLPWWNSLTPLESRETRLIALLVLLSELLPNGASDCYR